MLREFCDRKNLWMPIDGVGTDARAITIDEAVQTFHHCDHRMLLFRVNQVNAEDVLCEIYVDLSAQFPMNPGQC